jgi:multimeric flavodoxin WrbA
MLARLAASEAKRLGASTELLFLSDFSILECDGCMRCVFRGEECHLNDDLYRLLDRISKCDAFFVISPTYVLTIPGVLKLVTDRYLLMSPYCHLISGRPAVSIAVAGLHGWEQLARPLMNLFLLSLGFTIRDSFVAYGAGPGEALLDRQGVARLKSAIGELFSPQDDRPVSDRPVISSHCPVCFSTVFEKIGPRTFRCPVCLAVGQERDDGFSFDQQTLRNHRFTPNRMENHLEDWVLKTRSRFREKLSEISKAIRNMGLQEGRTDGIREYRSRDRR